ncbi:MAG: 7-cyano-7-deazaguanine synthase QueC [Elusimicrobiales bacterium]|nr:7-cyano-7-deazaguanine synthase QueC [Elusimicrobiales bacterium]
MKKAIISLSGGLDSTTCLAWSINKGYKCFAVTFDYGQRHIKEIKAAKNVSNFYNLPLVEIKLKFPWLEVSSLVNPDKKIPDLKYKDIISGRIPSTYVPARNLVFTSILASYADSIAADFIVLGPNAIDYSGYPDCRPEFYEQLGKAIKLGTRNKNIKILTPIINLSKSEIVKLAYKLNAPLKYTWSCYCGDKKPCGRCDSCKLRAKGFKEAGVIDPAL